MSIPQKGIEGSNPSVSANYFHQAFEIIIKFQVYSELDLTQAQQWSLGWIAYIPNLAIPSPDRPTPASKDRVAYEQDLEQRESR